MSDWIEIGGRRVGAGAPVLIIGEVGVNHDGDLATALALVDAAAEAGVDAVKFQTFNASQLATSTAELVAYQRERVTDAADQLELLARLELSLAGFEEIAARCRRRDVLFLSTPFDDASAALLLGLGVPAFKVGSGELTNLPFLRRLAGHGLPLLISTGMSDLREVRDAVDAVGGEGAPVVLLHCVSSYPAPPEEANLRAMDALRRVFDLPVGYSDHCLGLAVSLAAVARDACVLERHLTLDRTRPGPDHAMSLEPDELADLVRRVRALEQSLGDGMKRPQPSELDTRLAARRSLTAARPLSAGEVLTADAIAIKRPGGGIPPSRLASVLGRRVMRSLAMDEQLSRADLEDSA